ncbi:excisionase [Duganella sp. HSC-15S17]|nr:excisionase [Duganella violaceicalia]
MLELERQPVAQARTGIKPRFITLQEWAATTFSKVPHNNTLLRWVHEGRIHPQPEKIGRIWRVKPAAVYKAD